ncbi:hypothetical protein BSR29_00840 [Boudabousia liubingyangii]|uniref:Uncharacterized protein n=1 Tax=Boudabousia liubingyangii TaxID=1921764 RepID=A0A1Q5PPT8_9ACTO|nr:hypothetical protein [Boudabousia liubingyangii]OKL48441.1 hypothetical protein BSR28_01695 [Boudabousia liubingyangii]OKL49536.1 hypothetical protein BSR29_00840 [Boudabousia liubingyangii]
MSLLPKSTFGKVIALGGTAAAGILGTMFSFSQLSGKATKEENDWVYPSDDLIDKNYDNGVSSTYAIDIDAPAYAVWRIFKQIGCDKSGSFSSEFLERTFARLPFYNSYEMQEEFQQPDSLMPGDIAAFDYHGMSMEWTDVVPGKYLTQWVDTKNPPAAPGSYAFRFPGMKHYAAAWCFYMIPLPGNRTRLLNHWRVAYEPDTFWPRTINWINIELVGGCMAHLQNIYVKRLAEFRKKPQKSGKFMRGVLGGRWFNSGTPAGRWDGTPLFEETETQWMRYGRQKPAVTAFREPVTDNPEWPPTENSPWADIVDKEYFEGWTEPKFSWEEQIRQKHEKTYLPNWGKEG